MDNTKQFTAIEWCAGYGGIHLGLKRAIPNLRVIAFGEIEAFACANLVSKMEAGLMDAAPIWSDLKTFPCEEFRDRVDLLVAGYPCQPFSAAGRRAGKDDPRHLWPWIADGIRILRPRMCFFENVEGHISLGLSSVISDLEELGYKVSFGIFSAREIGAPHQRKRVFILAYRKCKGLEGLHNWDASAESSEYERANTWASRKRDIWPGRPNEPQHEWEPPRVVGNAIHNVGVDVCGTQCGQAEQSITSDSGSMGNAEQFLFSASREHGAMDEAGGIPTDPEGRESSQTNPEPSSSRKRESDGSNASECGQAQPSLGRDPHGSADWMDYAKLYTTCDSRTDELRLLGNGVVPSTAERAFRTLLEELYEQNT